MRSWIHLPLPGSAYSPAGALLSLGSTVREPFRTDAAENLVYLKGHKGPHPAEYHAAVYKTLKNAVSTCTTVAQCRSNLVEALKKLADEVCTPGSQLHELATKP